MVRLVQQRPSTYPQLRGSRNQRHPTLPTLDNHTHRTLVRCEYMELPMCSLNASPLVMVPTLPRDLWPIAVYSSRIRPTCVQGKLAPLQTNSSTGPLHFRLFSTSCAASIFMASMVAMVSPALIASPSETDRVTTPANGAARSDEGDAFARTRRGGRNPDERDCCAEGADGDLAAIGNQGFREHSSVDLVESGHGHRAGNGNTVTPTCEPFDAATESDDPGQDRRRGIHADETTPSATDTR